MSLELLVLFLLGLGFAASPLADMSAQRVRPRVAAGILLVAIVSVLGCFGFAFDRGYLWPEAWQGCGFFVLMGIGICLFVYRRHKFGLALVLAGAFVLTIVGLHFFAMDFVRTCQRTCVRIEGCTNPDQVRSVVFADFANRSDYRVVAGAVGVREGQDGYMSFELRPLYAHFTPESLQVGFSNGRPVKVSASAVQYPLSPLFIFELLGGAALYMIGFRRLCLAASKQMETLPSNFPVFEERLNRLRKQNYVWSPGHERAVLAKRTLIQRAGRRIRRLAFFAYRELRPGRDAEQNV
jgi:hypothetical protein